MVGPSEASYRRSRPTLRTKGSRMHDRSPSAPAQDHREMLLCTAFVFRPGRVDRSKGCRIRNRDTPSHAANPVSWPCRFLPTTSTEDGGPFPPYGCTKAATQDNGCDEAGIDQ